MNEKLFKTKMNSVLHYQEEIKKLSDAIKVTESTLKDLTDSFIEFIPYKEGDILINKNKVMKVVGVKGINRYSDGLYVQVYVKYPDTYGGYTNKENTESINLNELDKVKILYSEQQPVE